MPEAIGPQFLGRLQRDEGLGGGPVAVPVVLVLVADQGKVDGKRRIPIGHAIDVRHAFKVGSEIPIERDAFHRDNAGEFEDALLGDEFTARPDLVVAESHRVAGQGIEIAGRPFIE